MAENLSLYAVVGDIDDPDSWRYPLKRDGEFDRPLVDAAWRRVTSGKGLKQDDDATLLILLAYNVMDWEIPGETEQERP